MHGRDRIIIASATLAASIVAAVAQIPLHEGAHWLACLMFRGDGCLLFYNISGGTVAEGLPRLMQALAGPAIGLILVTLAAMAGQRTAKFGRSVALAVISVAGARPLIFSGVYARHWPATDILNGADEVRVAAMMGLPALAVIVMSVIIVVCAWVAIARTLDRPALAVSLPSIIVGGLAGTYLWLVWLGPTLLPWQTA